VSIKDRVGWAPGNKNLSCVLAHTGANTPRSQVARRSSSWTITYLTSRMIRRDSVWATHRLPPEVFALKTSLGRGRTWPDSLIVIAKGSHLFAFMATCVVLSGYFPCKVDYWFESLRHPRIWMRACSLRSNTKPQMLWWFALCILGWHWLFCSYSKMLFHTLHELHYMISIGC
jgi:hypothetical protein